MTIHSKSLSKIFSIIVVISIFCIGFFAFRHSKTISNAVQPLVRSIMKPFEIARFVQEPADTAIVLPVEGVKLREITDTWQAPRGVDRLHEGQDIFAKKGTPIYSATDGYVVSIGENTLGGKIIYVLGRGGYRYYYAHLDDYAPELSIGDRVSTTTVIGFVGNTGNAATTPAHLHFGIYTSEGPINPLPLMVERK